MWQYGSGKVWQKGYWGYPCLIFKTKFFPRFVSCRFPQIFLLPTHFLCKTLNIQQFNSKVRQMMTIFSFLLRNMNVINMMMGIVFHVLWCLVRNIQNNKNHFTMSWCFVHFTVLAYNFWNKECLCHTARRMSKSYFREIAIWCPISKWRLEISNDFNCITGPGNNNDGSDFLFLYSHQSRPGHDVSAGNSPRSALSLSLRLHLMPRVTAIIM